MLLENGTVNNIPTSMWSKCDAFILRHTLNVQLHSIFIVQAEYKLSFIYKNVPLGLTPDKGRFKSNKATLFRHTFYK